MPVRNYPFSTIGLDKIARPYLPATIINPASGHHIRVYALIDTGADECALPASFAPILNHDLQSGNRREISTGNGITLAYAHNIRIEITGFTTQDALIDFMPNLYIPLLGVRSFLSNFVLIVDYRKQVFSLRA